MLLLVHLLQQMTSKFEANSVAGNIMQHILKYVFHLRLISLQYLLCNLDLNTKAL